MLRAVNIGWLHPPSFVWSKRRSMRRLRLCSCRRILACTRNPSWLRSPRKQSTFLDSENTEGFRVFQGISPPTSGEFPWLGTRQVSAQDANDARKQYCALGDLVLSIRNK